jgi:hypothetical protein
MTDSTTLASPARLPARQPRQTQTHETGRGNAAVAGAKATTIRFERALGARAELVRRGNTTIRSAIRTQGRQRVPFLCECLDADCDEALWLILDEYDRRTQAGEPILVAGHTW